MTKQSKSARLLHPKGFAMTFMLFIMLFPLISHAEVVKNVTAEGLCIAVGMTAEQAKLTAVQNARMNIIEKASGVRITSSSVVSDGRLAVDFIRAYTSGYIVKESYHWHDIKQVRTDNSSAPIAEYGVTVTADVYIPKKKTGLGLKADINASVFKTGEKAKLSIKTGKDAQVAVFNITADDKVVMLYPNQYVKADILKKDKTMLFPAEDDVFDLEMATLEGHKTDSEAFFVSVLPSDYKLGFPLIFGFNEPMSFAEFFNLYSKIADDADDTILAYTIIGK